MQSFRYLFVSSVFIADRESTFIDRFVSFNSVRKVAQIYSACMLEKFSAKRVLFPLDQSNKLYQCRCLKGTVS